MPGFSDGPFTPADLNDDALRVVRVAYAAGFLKIEDVFCLGMTQATEDDWEDCLALIEHIGEIIDNDSTRDAIEKEPVRRSMRIFLDNLAEAEREAVIEP